MIDKCCITIILLIVIWALYIFTINILPCYAIHKPMPYHQTIYDKFAKKISCLSKDKYDISLLTVSTPDNINLDTIYIKNKDRDKCIIYFHGTSGNLSVRYEMIKFLYNFGSVVIFDYRGYGKSGNNRVPFINSIHVDGKTIWNYVVSKLNIDPRKISLFGEHLGCDVAIKLAEEISSGDSSMYPHSLILNSPSYSIESFLKCQSSVTHFTKLFANIFCKNNKNISNINCITNIIIAHSKNNEFVSQEEVLKLYDILSTYHSRTKFVDIGGNHNCIEITDQYIYTLAKLFN